jgi:hypothetical protein
MMRVITGLILKDNDHSQCIQYDHLLHHPLEMAQKTKHLGKLKQWQKYK